MYGKQKWLTLEYALAKESTLEKEFEKYVFTHIEKVCYQCEFRDSE